MTSKCFALNPFKRTHFLKVRAQCESKSLLTYLKLSTVLELSFPEPLSVKILMLLLVVPAKYYTNVCCYLVTQIQTYHIQTRGKSSFPICLKISKTINMRLSSIKFSDAFKTYFRAADLTCSSQTFISFPWIEESVIALLWSQREFYHRLQGWAN